MPDIHFEHSEPLTLGIEEEFVLVDAADGLTPAPRADELLDADWQTIAVPGGWMKAELLRTSIELTTAANRDLVQLDVDLRAVRDELVRRADALDMQVCGTGMHPTLLAVQDIVTPSEAHRAIAGLHERIGTFGDQVTHGIHVHVGMPGLEEALRVMDSLAGCVPMFVALTANSPVARSERSPWLSARSEVLRRMLWAGPPPRFADLGEYATVHGLHQLDNPGEQRFQWEVAPVPKLGTVEVRSFDSARDPGVALAMATLVQAIAAAVLDGQHIARQVEPIERHNRWSAMQYGVGAQFLDATRGGSTDVRELVRELVDQVRPYSAALGNDAWLGPIDELLDRPPVLDVVAAFEAGGAQAALAASRLTIDEAA